MRSLTIFLCALIILASTAAADDNDWLDAPKQTAKANENLRQALQSVDRIAILPSNGPGDPRDLSKVLFEIKGQDLVQSFGDTIDFTDWSPMECLCFGHVRMEFFRGDRYLFSCTYRHFRALHSWDGPWGGMAYLSSDSKKKFIDWFSAHAYPAFRDAKNEEDAYLKQIDDGTQRALSGFPEAMRNLFPPREEPFCPDKEKRAAQLAAGFPDKSAFIHACWRANAILQTPPFSSFRSPSGTFDLLDECLSLPSAADYRAALDALPAADALVWKGALSQVIHHKDAHLQEVVDGSWLAKLAEVALRDRYGFDVFTQLFWDQRRRTTPELLPILLRFVDSYQMKASTAASTLFAPNQADEVAAPLPSDFADAVLLLAQAHFETAGALLRSKLASAPHGEDRLALEVAIAVFQHEPSQIRPDHLRCRYNEVVEAAWQLISSSNGSPGLEFMIAAAQSDAYGARRAAEAQLHQLGLQALNVDDAISEPPIRSSVRRSPTAISLTELDRQIAAATSRESFFALLQRRGRAELETGNYSAAWNDLAPAGEVRSLDGAAAALALGRFYAADDGLRRLALENQRYGEDVALVLFRRGCVYFAQNSFVEAERYFAASLSIKHDEETDIFDRLARFHIGNEELTTPSHDEKEPDPLPYAAASFLRGNISAEKLLQAATPRHRPDFPSPENRALAHFVLSEASRLRNEPNGERVHLDACIATKAFATEAYSLAKLRLEALDDPVLVSARALCQ